MISYAQTDAITPSIVGPRMMGVVASVLAVVCKRAQWLPTLLVQRRWELLRPCWQWCANGCNNSQQHGTTCNKVCKRTQHVASNNVGSCWPTMLRRFAWGNRYIAVFQSVWWSRDSPVVVQCCIAIEVTLLRFGIHLRYLCKWYISSTVSIKNNNNNDNACVHLLNSNNRSALLQLACKFLSRFSW